MKRSSLAILIMAFVITGSLSFWLYRQQPVTHANSVPEIAIVTRGSLFSAVAATGRVVAHQNVDIKCMASGEVIQLPFNISDEVKKGDILLQLDPTDEQRAVLKAQATLASAEASLAQARQNYIVAKSSVEVARRKAQAGLRSSQVQLRNLQGKARRSAELFAAKLASQEDYDATQTNAEVAATDVATAEAVLADVQTQEEALVVKQHDVELAQAQVALNELLMKDAQQQLTYTTIRAPINGIVSARQVQIGTIIASGVTNVGGGTTVLSLTDTSRLYVYVSVDESDIGRVQIGQETAITVDAFPGQTFIGNVVRIAACGVNVSNIVTFEVRIEVTSANKSLLKPEMTANARVLVVRKEGVLLVPLHMLSQLEQENIRDADGHVSPHITATIGVCRPEGTMQRRQVTLGATDGLSYEVIAGLQEGEPVMLDKTAHTSPWQR